MKKLFLICLMMLTGSAWAEWVLVEISINDGTEFYIDSKTIRKEGNLRKAWELQNLKTPGIAGELSARGRYEYDCKNERARRLSGSLHSGAMAQGNTISADSKAETTWNEVAPGTISDSLLKYACFLK
jgi:hypothetical protein